MAEISLLLRSHRKSISHLGLNNKEEDHHGCRAPVTQPDNPVQTHRPGAGPDLSADDRTSDTDKVDFVDRPEQRFEGNGPAPGPEADDQSGQCVPGRRLPWFRTPDR